MYVVCKGKTLVYNRNITSFFTLKNLVISKEKLIFEQQKRFLVEHFVGTLIKIYRPQPLKSTGGILNKINSILVSYHEKILNDKICISQNFYEN